MKCIAHIAGVVNDYDEAIEFYTRKLNFVLIEDTRLSETKRWVIVAPEGSKGCSLLLAKAATEEQRKRIGDQTGGRVFLFLHTILTAITSNWLTTGFESCANRQQRSTELLPYLQTCMEIFGTWSNRQNNMGQ